MRLPTFYELFLIPNWGQQLYCRKDSFDKKHIKEYLYNAKEPYFQTAAKEFKLIEDNGRNVVVCWKNSMKLVEQLLDKGPTYTLMKKLSKYIVNIYKNDFESLLGMGVVSEKREGLYVVEYKQQYDENLGLRVDNNWTKESLII